jgi:hemerythrin
MPLIEWKEHYTLGIEEVDYEHRALVDALNELHEVLAAGDESAADVLGEIYAQIAAHFALEEHSMQLAGYAEGPAHKLDHERLLDELRDLMDDLEEGSDVDIDAFGARLDNWFSGHFSTFDARLHGIVGH